MKPHFQAIQRRSLLISALFFLLIFNAASVRPLEALPSNRFLTVGPQADSYDLAPYIHYLKDPSGQLALDDVLALDQAGKFIPIDAENISLGVMPDTLWLRFSLAGKPFGIIDGAPSPWLLDLDRPLEQSIRLFIPDGNDNWRTVDSCSERPCNPRTLFRQSVFRLLEPGTWPQTYYLRVKAKTAMLFFPRILTPQAFGTLDNHRILIQGFYFGLSLTMILFNLSIFIFLRDRTYLWYILYVLTLSVYFGTTYGLSIRFLPFIGIPDLIRLDLVCLGLTILIAAQFARSFLMTKMNFPRVDWILVIYMSFTTAVVLASSVADMQRVLPFFSILAALGPFVTIVPAVIALRQGFTPARFFLIGYAFFISGIVLFSLSYDGRIPLNIWFHYAFQIGSSLEIICLGLALGYRISVMRKEKEALAQSHSYYQKASLVDGLTGIYNRRYYERRILQEEADARLARRPLSLLVMDVDDFKAFNDIYGHSQGDQVLKRFGEILGRMARKSDAPCRYGGEEFVLILPQTDLEQAQRIAERLRQEFNRQEFRVNGEQVARKTISIGAATLKENEQVNDLFQRADQALYQAKNQGKNRVVLDEY